MGECKTPAEANALVEKRVIPKCVEGTAGAVSQEVCQQLCDQLMWRCAGVAWVDFNDPTTPRIICMLIEAIQVGQWHMPSEIEEVPPPRLQIWTCLSSRCRVGALARGQGEWARGAAKEATAVEARESRVSTRTL